MELNARDALFLDFDGTLAPLQDDPDAVGLEAAQTALLVELHACLEGALCLISGRDLNDLAARVPSGLKLVGNHGLRRRGVPGGQWSGREARAPEALLEAVHDLEDADVRAEVKGGVIALHYRRAPTRGAELEAALQNAVAELPDYRVEHGKRVLEVKPGGASKGEALREVMAVPPFQGRRPVMFGDDTTDEAGFEAAQELGGLGVKVGPGPTSARVRLADPAEVFAKLAEIIHGAR